MQKIGRNDSCWCGSGKKYKKCHLDREKQEAVNPWDLARRHNALFQRGKCLHPEAGPAACRGKAIRAHTVSRAASLSPIARDGHVYQVNANFNTLKRTGGLIDIEEIGINQASTFFGFCGFHDSQTFAPLESQSFQGNDHQLFLLAYRPLVKELYLKEAALKSIEILREADKGRSLDEQFDAQGTAFLFGAGTASALARLRAIKSRLDRELLAGDYKHIRSCVVNLDSTPDVVCSGVLQPEWDFQGNRLQDLGDLTVELDWLSFSILPTDTGGAAVFVWHEDDEEKSKAFVESLLQLPEHRIPDALVRLCFEGFENIFLAPDWWEGRPESKKRMLKLKAMAGLPSTGSNPRGLVEDLETHVSWKVSGISRNY